MGLAPSTVKDHVRAVLGKLGGLNRVQAAILADRAGLVTGLLQAPRPDSAHAPVLPEPPADGRGTGVPPT